MDLFPAIDLRDGRAVRLLRGDYNEMTVYSEAPIEVARDFKNAGANYLHLVDLDGAKDGDTPNFEVIKKIASESGICVQVGGGIRSMNTVERYISVGVMRVIIGTAAVTNPDFLNEAVQKFGDKIAVAVDIKDGFVATHGWVKTSNVTCVDFCKKLQEIGVKTVICTDISKDGAMQGVNVQLYEKLIREFSMDIIASGGVSSIKDLILLSETGVKGAILGKSLYTGAINLSEAITEVKKAECV